MSAKFLRVGIIGGTFDPIHTGHLVIAEAVRTEYDLDKIIFIPSANPPHKQQTAVLPAEHRYAMTLLATNANPHFEVSRMEMNRPGPSYTIDTVQMLLRQYGGQTEFYFITGMDAILELPSWRSVDQLLALCRFVAAARPGCAQSLDEVIAKLGDKGDRILRLTTPELEISSTDIRERIRTGRSITYIVPESVEIYINKEHLYCD